MNQPPKTPEQKAIKQVRFERMRKFVFALLKEHGTLPMTMIAQCYFNSILRLGQQSQAT